MTTNSYFDLNPFLSLKNKNFNLKNKQNFYSVEFVDIPGPQKLGKNF